MNRFLLFFISLFSIILVGCSEKVEKDDSPVLYSFDEETYTLNDLKSEKYFGLVDDEDLILYSLLKDRYEISEENLESFNQEKESVNKAFKEIAKNIKDETELESLKQEEKHELFYMELSLHVDTFLDNVIQVMPSEVSKLSENYHLVKAVVGYFGGSISDSDYKNYVDSIKNIDSEEKIYDLDDSIAEKELDISVSYQELTKKTLQDVSHYKLFESNVGDILEFEATTRTPKMVYKVLDKIPATEDIVYEDIRNEKATKLFTSSMDYLNYFTTLEKLKFTYNKDIFKLIKE